jgi:hypothetical protein
MFVLLVCSAAFAEAQGDFRNLDAGRPIAVEDAQPVEFRALEMQLGIPKFTRESKGHWVYAIERETKIGLWKNLQAGYSSEFVIARRDGNTVVTSRDSQLHLLYNFNQETRRMPAIAIRPELGIRSGGLGSQHEHGALKLIASKTVNRNRFHLNGSYTIGPTEVSGRGGDLVNRFFYGAAYERTFPLQFVVLVVDVYARKPIDHAKTQVVFDVGTRVQLTPKWVLDASVTAGLRPSAGPDYGFTFGLNRHFSFRWLFPKGAPKTETKGAQP